MMKFNVSIIIFVLCIAGINTKSNCEWNTIVDTQSNEKKRETNLNLSAICDGICGKVGEAFNLLESDTPQISPWFLHYLILQGFFVILGTDF